MKNTLIRIAWLPLLLVLVVPAALRLLPIYVMRLAKRMSDKLDEAIGRIP